MRPLALIILVCLIYSLGCKEAAVPQIVRTAHPGLLPSRPDPAEKQYFIKRYTGYLGTSDSIPLELLMVNWGNGRLSGQTYYSQHYGLLQFEGQLNEDQTFELKEKRHDKHNATFIGQFYGTDSIQGTWWNIDSTMHQPFNYAIRNPTEDYDGWTGAWHLNDPWDTSTLIIGGVTAQKLQFAMTIYINGYREMLYGTADIREQRAVFDLEIFPIFRENCKIVLYRKGREIYLDQESFPFLCDLEPNCWTSGHYEDIYLGKKARMDFIGQDSVFADSMVYQRFVNLVGPDFQNQFAYNMERLEYHKVYEESDQIFGTLWKGRVRGFHLEKEGFIMYDTLGHMWAATTTPPDYFKGPMQVHYFTNTKKWKNRMPTILKEWVDRFYACTVLYETQKIDQ